MLNVLFILLILYSSCQGSLILKTEPQVLVQDEPATIKCISETSDSRLSIFKNGILIQSCSKSECNDLTYTNDSITIAISNVSRESDAGIWSCVGEGSNVSIEVEVFSKGEFLVVGGNEFVKIDTTTGEQTKLNVTLNTSPLAIAFDPTTDQIYWSDWKPHHIKTAALDGDRSDVITGTTGAKGVFSTTGMDIDYIHNLLYYTDRESKSINVVSLENYDYRLTLIYTDINDPRSLVVVPTLGIMFWSQQGENIQSSIEMAEMDGSNRKQFLLFPASPLAVWLCVDIKEKTLYWADYTLHTVEAMSIDKSNRRVIHRSLNGEYLNMALLGNFIYLNDHNTKHIYSMTKSGENMKLLSTDKFENTYELVAYSPNNVVSAYNICVDAGCQQICLPKINGSYTCGCKNGFKLSNDRKTCLIDKSTVVLTPSQTPYTVIKGRQLQLVCTVNASASNAYEWRKNGTRLFGAWSSILTIDSVEEDNDGEYTCSYDQDGVTKTSTIYIEVLYPPVIMAPVRVSVMENSTLSVTCNAKANPSEVYYKWTGPTSMDVSTNAGQENITIPDIQREQSGNYTCTALNTMVPSKPFSHPITSRTHQFIFVDVLYGPTNPGSYHTVNITLNEALDLTCTVSSNPQPSSYVWYDPNGEIASRSRNLVIRRAGVEHEGVYVCNATILLESTDGESSTVYFQKRFDVVMVPGGATAKRSQGDEVQTSVIIGVSVLGLLFVVLFIVVLVVAIRSRVGGIKKSEELRDEFKEENLSNVNYHYNGSLQNVSSKKNNYYQ